VRAEDKRIGIDKDDAESEQRRRQDRAQDQERHLEAFDDLPTHQQQEHETGKRDRCAAMMRIVESIFRKDEKPLEGLTQSSGFTAEELQALEFLEAAVKGRDAKLTHLVYAEDREDLLEQALAVLYPTLSHGMEQSASALRAAHDELVGQVTLLREEIASKEDAQEDIISDRQRVVEEDKADDEDDDDKDDDDDEEEDDKDDAAAADKSGDDDDDGEDDAAATDDGGVKP
jgi:hypothetical protein